MSGHGHPSPIDFFMSIVSMPLPLSNSTLTVRAPFLQGIHFMTVKYDLLLSSNHRIFLLTSGSYSTLALLFVPSWPTPCLCRCVLNVTFLLAFSSSILSGTPFRLQGLASWCKVNHTGGKEDGERAQAREAMCVLSPFQTRGRSITSPPEEEGLFSISGHHHQLMVMWHQHVPQQFLT